MGLSERAPRTYGCVATVVAHTVVLAVRDPRAPAATAAPIQTADHPAPTQHKCPAPATGVVRTAPAVRDNGDTSSRTVALTFDDGPGPAVMLHVLVDELEPGSTIPCRGSSQFPTRMLQRITAGVNAGGLLASRITSGSAAGWSPGEAGPRDRTHSPKRISDDGLQPCPPSSSSSG